MVHEKFHRLTDRLLSLTEQGKLLWQPTAHDRSFACAFADYSVRITESGFLEPLYRLELSDGVGRPLESVSSAEEGLDKVLCQLYELARRQALGADKAVEDLLSQLEKIA